MVTTLKGVLHSMKRKSAAEFADPKKSITFSNDKISTSLAENMDYLKREMAVGTSFDLVYRTMEMGGMKTAVYSIDGFTKDDTVQRILNYLITLDHDKLPKDAHELSKAFMPYGEIDLKDTWKDIAFFMLSGVFCLFVDGFDRCILIDTRTYPARGVSEPEKDKTLRGSRDGFVETIVFNTALIRRRIRSSDLRMEMLKAGNSTITDIVLCYMDSRVDKKFLDKLRNSISSIDVDALTMNQESLAECLYTGPWINPFPKFKFTERPDAAAAQILEGDIVILVDNSPSAMITPTSVFDVTEEADDYYFPPVTGTYLRIARTLIAILTYVLPPLFLLLINNPQLVPPSLEFIRVTETINVPILMQFLILELAIDGLRLAAVNTPSMLSTPLSIMAALVLGEFSVKSGWFNSEVMLYMAFVALSSYTQPSYEMSYALKFLRIINLILTQIFGLVGFILGLGVLLVSLLMNKTIAGTSYLYPLIPLNAKELFKRLVRFRIPENGKP